MNLSSPQAQIVLDPYDLWVEDFNSEMRRMALHPAVNRTTSVIVGSSPTLGA